MSRYQLKEGEYWGHEMYFPDEDPPQEIIDELKSYGFIQGGEGFFIPREGLAIFVALTHPYRVDFLQPNILCGGIVTKELMNQLLDGINQLKAAGVQGVDKFCEKIKRNS